MRCSKLQHNTKNEGKTLTHRKRVERRVRFDRNTFNTRLTCRPFIPFAILKDVVTATHLSAGTGAARLASKQNVSFFVRPDCGG